MSEFFWAQHERQINEAKKQVMRREDELPADFDFSVLKERLFQAVKCDFEHRLIGAQTVRDGLDAELLASESVGYNVGHCAAVDYARSLGATDETLFQLIGDFGFHVATLKIDVMVEQAKDRIVKGPLAWKLKGDTDTDRRPSVGYPDIRHQIDACAMEGTGEYDDIFGWDE